MNTKITSPLQLIIDSSFSLDMNCNDFFAYACAWGLTVNATDIEWMIPIIEKYNMEGLNACQAYIANTQPIGPYLTENFLLAIEDLKVLNPEVYTDIDNEKQYYKDGPYRKLSIF